MKASSFLLPTADAKSFGIDYKSNLEHQIEEIIANCIRFPFEECPIFPINTGEPNEEYSERETLYSFQWIQSIGSNFQYWPLCMYLVLVVMWLVTGRFSVLPHIPLPISHEDPYFHNTIDVNIGNCRKLFNIIMHQFSKIELFSIARNVHISFFALPVHMLSMLLLVLLCPFLSVLSGLR